MTQIRCAACQTVLEAPAKTTICTCGYCGQRIQVPDRFTHDPHFRKQVRYLHHTRDTDGDVIFYFLDPLKEEAGIMQSSPIVGIATVRSAVLDVTNHGRLGKYVIVTQNTAYEVQMPADKADHLLLELTCHFGDRDAS
jgi:hypothetical protein